MTTASIETRPAPTMADLLHDLGDIPPNRVLVRPYPATEEDVLRLDAQEDRLCELVDGVLVEKPMGLRESILASFIIFKLQEFVVPRRLGAVSGEAGMMKLRPQLIRIPDVAYIRIQSTGPKIPNQPVPAIAPTLAVEILSAGNTPREIERKMGEYFAAGTELAWVIDPDTRTAEVYTAPTNPLRVDITGALPGEPALPGFSLPMKELFDELDRQMAR